MSWLSLRIWRGLFRRAVASSRRPVRLGLRLEALEDRSVPSVTPLGTQAPVVANDWSDTDGTTPVTLSVLANDSAAPGSHLLPASVHVSTEPHSGKATVDLATGDITYAADKSFSGTDVFQYTVVDNLGRISAPATVSVRVNRPVAGDDWSDTDGTTPVTVNVLANDSDPDGNQHIVKSSVTVVVQPHYGSAVVDPTTGTITYKAHANFAGTDSFQYTVTDDNGGVSKPATVLIRVNRPTAANDLARFTNANPVTVNVLANDTDPDGNGHIVKSTVTVVTNPLHGAAVVNHTTGQITYTPNAGFDGTDTFKYTVTDDNGGLSEPGTVTVVGTRSHTTNDDFSDTDGTTPVVVNVLSNDSEVGAKFLPSTVQIVANPQNGTAKVNLKTGAVTYTANTTFSGTDTFKYTVIDSLGHVSAPATVSVRVNRPVAGDDWSDTDGTTPVTVNVLANDADPDGNQHLVKQTVTIFARPRHGTVTVDKATGEITYTADADFTGTDKIRYTVTDDNGGVSKPANLFIRVNRPTAADDFAQALGTKPVAINVLANDSDPDGNQHIVKSSVTVIADPQHGQVSVNKKTGEITYTANPGFTGTDTFRYTVTDDNGGVSEPGTVTVITLVPSAPPLSVSGKAAASLDINALAFATDPDGPTALKKSIVRIVSAPEHGTVVVDSKTGDITYVPRGAFTGADKFEYTITDSNGATSAPIEVLLTVLPSSTGGGAGRV